MIRRWWFDLADGGQNSDARGGAIGAPRVLVVPEHQAAKEDHHRVAENVANSPRAFLRPEKARGEEATRGGGSFLR